MNKNKLLGIGLLELMLSLAIIAILLVMATRYYQTTRTSQQVNEAAEMVLSVYSAGASWLQNNNNFNSVQMSNFVANASVPSDFSQPNINPWGGNITAAAAQNVNSQLTVQLSSVPQTACQNLAQRIQAKLNTSVNNVSCNGGAFSATFNYNQ